MKSFERIQGPNFISCHKTTVADNIGKDNRINAGARFHVTPFFWVDGLVREIGKDSTFTNGAARKMERVVQLKYIGSF